MKKDTYIHTYINPFISPTGVVYVKCDGCRTLKRASTLEQMKVQVGHTFVKLGGPKVLKGGGRITYTKVRLVKVPKLEWQHRCIDCR